MNLKTYPVSLDEKIAHTCFPRLFISDVYGGNTQEMEPTVKFKENHQMQMKYGYFHFTFANLNWNPFFPRLPGRPGLFFEACLKQRDGRMKARIDEDKGEAVVAFVRQAAHEWLCNGMYRTIRGREMTREEYNMLAPWVCQI